MPVEGAGGDIIVVLQLSANLLCEDSFPFPKKPFPVLHRVLLLLFFWFNIGDREQLWHH